MYDSRQIEADIRAKLEGDPRLPAVGEIAVEAYGDAVTLRGTVGSFSQRRAAVDDARRTPGVVDVLDELEVHLLPEHRRRDAEIRGVALQRLIWDADVPAEYVAVEVNDGWVTLSGQLDFQFQSDAAFNDVASVYGVTGVTNAIKVVQAV